MITNRLFTAPRFARPQSRTDHAPTKRCSAPVARSMRLHDVDCHEWRGDLHVHGFRTGPKSVRAALFTALTGTPPPPHAETQPDVVDLIPRFWVKDYPNGATGPLLAAILTQAEKDLATKSESTFTYAMSSTVPGAKECSNFFGVIKRLPGQEGLPLEERDFRLRVNPHGITLTRHLDIPQNLSGIDLYVVPEAALPANGLVLDLGAILAKLTRAFGGVTWATLDSVAAAIKKDGDVFNAAIETSGRRFDVALRIVADQDYTRMAWVLDPSGSGLLLGMALAAKPGVQVGALNAIFRPLQITLKGAGKSEMTDPGEIALCTSLGQAAYTALRELLPPKT